MYKKIEKTEHRRRNNTKTIPKTQNAQNRKQHETKKKNIQNKEVH